MRQSLLSRLSAKVPTQLRRSINQGVKFFLALLFSGVISAAGYSSCEALLESQNLLREIISVNKFATERNLSNYYNLLGQKFESMLSVLKSEDLWLDSGAGQVNAQNDYLRMKRFQNAAKTLAVSYQMKESPNNRVKVIVGEFFEKIANERLGSPKLITDLFGVFSYSNNPGLVLRKYLEILKEDGALFLFYGSHGRESQFVGQNGETVKMWDWLKSLPGIGVYRLRFLDKQGAVIIINDRSKIEIPETPVIRILPADAPPPIRVMRVETTFGNQG